MVSVRKTNVVKRRQKQKKEEITIRHGTQPYNKSLFNTCQRYTTGEKHVVAYVREHIFHACFIP